MINEWLLKMATLLSPFVTTRRRQHMERPPSVSAMKKDNCWLGIWICAIVSCKMPHQHVFLSHTGKPMTQSTVASALSSSFGNSGYKQCVTSTQSWGSVQWQTCTLTIQETKVMLAPIWATGWQQQRSITVSLRNKRNSLKCTQIIHDTLSSPVEPTSQVVSSGK